MSISAEAFFKLQRECVEEASRLKLWPEMSPELRAKLEAEYDRAFAVEQALSSKR